MTQEEKELLLKDLCGRWTYGVKVERNGDVCEVLGIIGDNIILTANVPTNQQTKVINIKPYLRPLSSMTVEERAEMSTAIQKDRIDPYGEIKNFGEDNLLLCTIRQSTNLQDWLNKKMFDYRRLIPMGLALESPEGMYIL